VRDRSERAEREEGNMWERGMGGARGASVVLGDPAARSVLSGATSRSLALRD
jgi:hypothetical protein